VAAEAEPGQHPLQVGGGAAQRQPPVVPQQAAVGRADGAQPGVVGHGDRGDVEHPPPLLGQQQGGHRRVQRADGA
jgi:hypothetical protein